MTTSPADRSDPLEAEADHLWLARAIAGPDAWRTRATSAAGLLSAAAAASVAGLLVRDEPSSTGLTLSALTAAVAYVVAVLAFLVAGVLPSPKPGQAAASVDSIWDYCQREARPIKRAVALGTVAAGVAITATAIAIVIAVTDQRLERRPASITFVEPATQEALLESCPGIAMPLQATITYLDSSRLQIHLPSGECGDTDADLDLRRDEVLVVLHD